jgi:maltoporin
MRRDRIVKAVVVLSWLFLAGAARAGDDRLSMFGYFRVLEGTQVSPTKGNFTTYGLPGTSKLRLGNETDWAEFGMDMLAFKGEDGTTGHAVIMLGWGYDVNAIGKGMDVDKPGFQQLYVDLKKLPGVDATFWLGKKYYKRQYSPINDLFYWSHQGFGAGMEDLNLGGAKLSYAILSATQSAKNSGLVHDLRVSEIPILPGGQLTVGVELAHPLAETQTPSLETGWAVNAQWIQEVLKGSNQLALQYGAGPLGNSSQFGVGDPINLQTSKDARKARLIDALSFGVGPDVALDLVAVLQHDEQNAVGAARNWVQAGGRVTYFLSNHVSLLLEAGYDVTKAPGVDSRTLLKVTPAIELSAWRGGTPHIRLFATAASWNDASASVIGQIAGGGVGVGDPLKRTALNIGLQAEGGF